MSEKKYTPWERFDPGEYVERNYGDKVPEDGILPEDQEVIEMIFDFVEKLQKSILQRFLARLLSFLLFFWRPKKIRVGDGGCGPNVYGGEILEAVAAMMGREVDSVDMIEYADPNIRYLETVFGSGDHIYRNGEVEVDTHKVGNKFDRFIEKVSGVKGTFKRLLEHGRIVQGSIFKLKRAWYKIFISLFVAESITKKVGEVVTAIKSVIDALEINGIFIIAMMEGSKQYHAGTGTNFPATELYLKDIQEIFGSIRGIRFYAGNTSDTDEKLREDYQGMVVIVGQVKWTRPIWRWLESRSFWPRLERWLEYL